MSKVGEFVENIYSKISWKVIGYIFIGLFLFKSCQSCNRSNKIERLEKNHITVVDSINNVSKTFEVRCDSLTTEIEKRDLIISGKNEVKDALNLNKNASDIVIRNLQDTISNLKKFIRKKNGEISNLNIEIGRLKRENAELSQH